MSTTNEPEAEGKLNAAQLRASTGVASQRVEGGAEAKVAAPEPPEPGEGFFGFEPLPANGVEVTNELKNQLRLEDAY